MKRSKKILLTLIVLIVLAIIGVLAYSYLSKDKPKEIKVIQKISKYDYELKENETKLYKDEFDNLDKILSKNNVDYKEYAKSIAKLFIIDFYTLDNKLSKNDIGGIDFIEEDMQDNFIDKARSTFYKYVEVKEGRKQKLPVVSSITNVEVEETTFDIIDNSVTTTTSKYNRGTKSSINKITKDAYKVTISWEYEEDLDYETEAKMIIIEEDKKLYIVEMD